MRTPVTHILADRLREGDVLDVRNFYPGSGPREARTVVAAVRTQDFAGSPAIRCITRESSKTCDFAAGSMVYIQGEHPDREGS